MRTRTDQFRSFVLELESKYSALWWSTDDSTPVIGEPVPRERQEENAVEAERLLHALAGRIERYPDTEPERTVWRESVKREIRRFGEERLGWPEGYRSILLDDGFYRSTADFARRARSFDEEIQAEDVAQALRNVWIMNSLQMLLDLEVGFSPAIFAYSMLYPYTDNYLDDESVPAASKRSFNRRLGLCLAGRNVAPLDPRQKDVFRLLERIEDQYPRAEFPEVHWSLMTIHKAQVDSLLQQRADWPADEGTVLRVSVAKGGASLLADGYLVAPNLSRAEADFCFGYGVFLQLLDDLQDVTTDGQGGAKTLFTIGAETGNLDRLASRLYRFMHRVVSTSPRFAAPSFADRKDLILRNCTFLLVGAVAEHQDLFTDEYIQDLERYWPLDFASMRDLRLLAHKVLKRATQSLLRKKRAESVFELL